MTPAERKRLEAVLPFYVNGRADEPDRSFVEAMLGHAEARAMLEWHDALSDKVKTQVDAVDDSVGWSLLIGKVREKDKPASAGRSNWRAWLGLDRYLPRPLQAPAFAALLLVVTFQGVLLHRHDGPAEGDLGATRGAAPSPTDPAAKGDLLQVNFKDETTEHDLRMLMIATGASIVQGPGQLGDYLVTVPAGRADAATQELQASKWVNAVRLVKRATATP